ncbi:amidohydrolase [uncultured Pseudokineococcus sp.]|uniref:amidohydrolase n=1 Tax=uncultured Pseudokineococcus sp. TaxID=1642928 RepID=UPI00260C8B71|nr:amidohydrolase [uncultured Pseudokineococcus sp.]
MPTPTPPADTSGAPLPPDPAYLAAVQAQVTAAARAAEPLSSSAQGAPPELVRAVVEAVEALGPRLVALSHDLAEHPETAFEEHRSAGVVADLATEHGLDVERGAHGLPTALRADVRGGGGPDAPVVAVMSEYDALPGIGHGCGHNVIAAAGLGAALGLAALGDRLPGGVRWLGTPAEEGGGGKETMAQHGALDGVDAAVMVHPFGYDVADHLFLGRRQLRATFAGLTAHASAQPFMGRNALDAVALTYQAVGLHRQQMPPSDRVHCVVTEGGDRPNVIPGRAQMLFYLRSERPETLRVLSERLDAMCRGAALMTGCGVDLAWDESPATLPVRANGPLAGRWGARMAERGRPVLPSGVVPALLAASTDFGNVSFRVPSLHPMIGVSDPGTSLHTREFAAAAAGPAGDRAVVDGAVGLALVLLDHLADPQLRAAVHADFEAAGGAVDVPAYFDAPAHHVPVAGSAA